MSEAKKDLSPSQQLSKRIVQRLAEKKLLDLETGAKIEQTLAEGKMQSADWKLVFEKSLGLHKKA